MAKRSAQLYRVSPEQVNQTLGATLRQWLPETPSWGEVRQLLRTRHILVNGNLCLDEQRRLKQTDVVKVLPFPAAPLPRESDVAVLYLDRELIVVDKPSGLTSVRHAEEKGWNDKRRQQNPTLEDFLPRIIARQDQQRRAPRQQSPAGRRPNRQHRRPNSPLPRHLPRVRPVHRIDRDTSGVMVFARTVEAERQLIPQFKQHTTTRRYLAIVHGDVPSQTFESHLVRDRGDGRRGSAGQPGVGKRAVTHVTPLEQLGKYTLLECRLETGRTHQIRIHLSEAGHPLCGDKIYGADRFGKRDDPSGAPRLALHAARLEFLHPGSGKPLRFTTPLPKDLQQFLDRLRKELPEK
jgi:23S rRNA pseudouridine1911/1915/1917 synthase